MAQNRDSFMSKMLQSKAFFVILLIITVVSSVRLANEITRRIKINREISSLKADIERLRKEHDSLSSLMEYLNTDEYIESEARKKLNLKKQGESIVVVQEKITDEQLSAETRAQNSQPGASVIAWWNYFFSDDKE